MVVRAYPTEHASERYGSPLHGTIVVRFTRRSRRMKIFTVVSFLTLLALSLACVTAPPPKAPVATMGPCTVSLHFHGDIEFTPSERLDIESSMKAWKTATDGAACLSVVWDLNFDSMESVSAHEEDHVILKVNSMVSIVQSLDELADGAVLGFVFPPGGVKTHKPVRLFLVYDRLTNRMGEVSMHELGHTMGMQHTKDPWSVMYFASTPESPKCLTRPDMAEFCRVNECNGHSVKVCE